VADHDIRVLDESNVRDAHTLFRDALHLGRAPDEMWERVKDSYQPGRTFGAFHGDELVGTTQSWQASLAVPGGAEIPMAAVSRIGVRADWTRRGVLSALLRHQLRTFQEAGEIASTLRASEAVIYGRFGYGVATRGRTVRFDRVRSTFHPVDPGQIRLVDADTAARLVPELYTKAGLSRPGMHTRWPSWWTMNLGSVLRDDNGKVAVHTGPDGDDGYLVYAVKAAAYDDPNGRAVLTVYDCAAATTEAWSALWRFVFRVDVVDDVVGPLRPLDEPLEWLVVDRRRAKVTEVEDETWLRLVDVQATLSARTYGQAEPVVLEVRDHFLPDNDGAYRITPDGPERTDRDPDLALDVDLLAATYLGDVTFTTLAEAGRIEVADPAALKRADILFATDRAPWSGTYF
jgi:predicted acetyltransferase